MAASAPASNPMSPQAILTNPAANAAARNVFLSTAIQQSFVNQPITGLAGVAGSNTARQRLENYGILCAVDMLVSMTVTNNAASGGSALAPSPGFPYNLIDEVTFTPYNSQTERIFCSGLELFQRNAVHKARVPYGAVSLAEGSPGTPMDYPTSATTGAIAAASSATVQFAMRIPISVGMLNTVGALFMQGISGDSYVSAKLALNNATGGLLLPFTGDYSISNASVQFVQQYYQAQGANPILPLMDFSTVYELAGKKVSTTNFAANQDKFIDMPNSRIVHGTYVRFYNGGFNYGTDLNKLELRSSGNTTIDNNPPLLWILRQREMLGADLLPGWYYYSSARVPIETNLLGQFQIVLNPNVVNSGIQTETMFESTYMVNQPLPGIGG